LTAVDVPRIEDHRRSFPFKPCPQPRTDIWTGRATGVGRCDNNGGLAALRPPGQHIMKERADPTARTAADDLRDNPRHQETARQSLAMPARLGHIRRPTRPRASGSSRAMAGVRTQSGLRRPDFGVGTEHHTARSFRPRYLADRATLRDLRYDTARIRHATRADPYEPPAPCHERACSNSATATTARLPE
jgi:hypothetical protein